MKKYDSYKDSGIEWIGEIPSHWESWKISHAFNRIGSGTTPESGNPIYHENGTINWLNTGDLNDSVLDFCSKKITTRALKDYSSLKLFPSGSLVMAMYGATIGKTAILNFETTTNQACCVFCENSIIELKFLQYWFVGNKEQIINLAIGGGQPNISQNILKDIRVWCPNYSEQIKLTQFLDHKTSQIDDLIAKKDALIQLLEEERAAMINQAVTKGLDPAVPLKESGVEWLGEIPEHWAVVKVKQIFNSSKGLTITKENLISDGIPCVNYGEIHSKFGFELNINEHMLKCVHSDYRKSDFKSLIKTGDFVFADTSEDISGAGNFTYLKSNHEIFAGYHTIILRATRNIEPRFFAYLFNSISFRTLIRQSVKGIKVFSITQSMLKNTSLWIPSSYEQKQIIEFLDTETDRIFSLINSAKKEIKLLQEYKTALISKVVTGKVNVTNDIT
ncbi:restriction endonuclease subunit S [Aquirufa antheringensis]|uniref:Restriction endonuclease subunit S n=1 Tax=Aquirufa antheringensis TaxID=2516559 RepID=A0A4Q9BGZ1_9BACT|nr:restriction endonuclease subunit S [Aquirufa antheringensis]MCZ2477679.1 restriction endonuclease subunit S [Aquirufa antheringensis]MCZ2485072.1 restriction endonuclease subunit S [Aquirufa antheringensis]TBH75377.1 restriction endonuclease subunit S [Aquirufa antheringensis]